MKDSITNNNLLENNFISKFPVGTIISYVESVSHKKAGVRTIFRIDKYKQYPKGYYNMYGIWCGFDFQTNKYKKEFSWTDLSKWHCIDCTDELMSTSLGTLLHKFNDVRVANELEKHIFYTCLNKL